MTRKNILIISITFFTIFIFSGNAFAGHVTSNIPPTPLPNELERHAWNDVIGWIDFGPEKIGSTHHGVEVADTEIKGYASSSVGFIAINCDSSPNGDICGTIPDPDFFVSNDGNGNLAGWAWSDVIGWISFCGNATSGSPWDGPTSTWKCPPSPTYQVTISTTAGPTLGDFSGWAWNDIVGWISFNCNNSGIGDTCATSNYKVKTTWGGVVLPAGDLTSSIFDTCPNGTNCGVSLNTIMWRGTEPTVAGNYVKFQIASSDCSNGATNPPVCDIGTWTFVGSGSGYYGPSSPDKIIKVSDIQHKNKRYFRYKVYLAPCEPATCGSYKSPVIKDVIINWSP